MEGFCRGCLVKFDDPMELLQYTEKNRRLYIYSTGLQVKRNDAIMFQLCKDCYLSMKTSCKFKKQCRTSDKQLKNYLALKKAGDATDLCTFLKNNDDSLMLRLPTTSGNSTPAYQKPRDDDNESTCTSIRNFMTEILEGDEIPDAEARIIREVIEEEADVLDDSLDSHWLQDDASIDTDFRLDFSFSPFSTPRSINNDHCYTPSQLKEQNPKKYQFNYKTTEPDNSKLMGTEEILNNDSLPEDIEYETENLYEESVPICDDSVVLEEHQVCCIDRKIEEALKDEEIKDFPLDNLISTPRINPTASGMSTPTITNILFGEKLDLDQSNDMFKSGQEIETFRNVQGDINLDEFFNNNPKEIDSEMEEDIDIEIKLENVEPTPPEKEITEHSKKYDLDDFYCNMCDKKYKSKKGIKIHLSRYHKIRIAREKKPYKNIGVICNLCGKTYSDKPSLIRHLKLHEFPQGPVKCKLCTLEFSSEAKLKMHSQTHNLLKNKKNNQPVSEKRFICSICGSSCSNRANLIMHMRRHNKNYSLYCVQCNQGFYRTTDLSTHMRVHSGERPFPCPYCERKFRRRDALSKHMKLHIDERPFKCIYCKMGFIKELDMRNHIRKSKNCIKMRLHQTLIAKDKAAGKKDTRDSVIFLLPKETEDISDETQIPEENANEVLDEETGDIQNRAYFYLSQDETADIGDQDDQDVFKGETQSEIIDRLLAD